MISISMFLQSILIFTGNWRKYSANGKLQSLVWLAYSLADWWATLCLGVLSSRAGCLKDNSIDPRFAISAFYAPFFLLHLGGPDTITAFSLEDNELWKRHSLTLFGQVGVAVYVIYRGWTKTAMNKLAIPMFLPGIIQICERLWALRSASSENFKASMLRQLRPPDRGPSYARYMEEFDSKKYRIQILLIYLPTFYYQYHHMSNRDYSLYFTFFFFVIISFGVVLKYCLVFKNKNH